MNYIYGIDRRSSALDSLITALYSSPFEVSRLLSDHEQVAEAKQWPVFTKG